MKNLWRVILAWVLCLCLILAVPMAARADVGGFAGDSDYGGSDWGGGSDSDWGDSDWSSSSSGGGGGGFGIEALVIGIILIIIIVQSTKKSRGGSSGRSGRSGKRPVAPGASRTPDSQLTPIAQYGALDEGFDAAALSEKLSNWYVRMQNAWQAKDFEPMRPYFTDTLFAQFQRQLNALASAGRTNYVERIAVLGVTLRGYFRRDGQDHIVAELRTRIVDYTVDDKTGAVISGSRTAEKFMTYEWELVRPSGQITRKPGQMQSIHCPNCGAPLNINQSAKCEYCGSIITLEDHDFVISAIKGISQRTN